MFNTENRDAAQSLAEACEASFTRDIGNVIRLPLPEKKE